MGEVPLYTDEVPAAQEPFSPYTSTLLHHCIPTRTCAVCLSLEDSLEGSLSTRL